MASWAGKGACLTGPQGISTWRSIANKELHLVVIKDQKHRSDRYKSLHKSITIIDAQNHHLQSHQNQSHNYSYNHRNSSHRQTRPSDQYFYKQHSREDTSAPGGRLSNPQYSRPHSQSHHVREQEAWRGRASPQDQQRVRKSSDTYYSNNT